MNILVLTTIYKDIDDPKDAATTPIVQNFAKEWRRTGHNVIVVHNFNVFPRCLYWVPQKVWDKLSAKKGFRTILSIRQRRDIQYERDGVKVYRSTILKRIPLGAYTQRALDSSVEKIRRILRENDFQPDVILAHMENPQIYQVYRLRETYPKVVTGMVFHKIDYLNRDKYQRWREEYLPAIDKIGFRSLEAYRAARDQIGFDRDYFLCPSGIANAFVQSRPDFDRKFKEGALKLLFVGQLIPRKHADTVIQAVHAVDGYKGVRVTAELVGVGNEEANLKELARRLGVEDRIVFSGLVCHDEVLKKMSGADVFVMVSENEVFGLVYPEAMSQGCVVVASSVGGMEGIVHDGKNGFMCEAGNAVDLERTLRRFLDMSRDEKLDIAVRSYETAQKYTESSVAAAYLENVVGSNMQKD